MEIVTLTTQEPGHVISVNPTDTQIEGRAEHFFNVLFQFYDCKLQRVEDIEIFAKHLKVYKCVITTGQRQKENLYYTYFKMHVDIHVT